jgi:hypothetical protein
MAEVIYDTELDMQQIVTTTARELIDSSAEDKFGLLDCPLQIACAVGAAATRYQIIFDRPLFSSDEFIDFHNVASPSKQRQLPGGIAGDWVFATGSHSSTGLASGHAKIPAWKIFTERAEAYTALASNASKPPSYGVDFVSLKANLPELKPYDTTQQRVRALVTSELRDLQRAEPAAMPKNQSLETIREYALKPPKLFLKRMEDGGFVGSRELLKHLVSIRHPNYAGFNTKMVIRNFAKWPFAERQAIQSKVVDILCGVGGEPPEELIDLLSKVRVLQVRLGSILKCINADGVPSYADARQIRSSGMTVPLDYRDVERPCDETVSTVDYALPLWRMPVWYLDRNGDYRSDTREFRGSPRKLRDVVARPIVEWQVDRATSSRIFSDKHRTIDQEAELPTLRVEDGVFGLVAVHYLDQVVELPKTRSLKVYEKPRSQDMGAAQLPLLALMFKKEIVARSKLLTAAEELTAK